MAEKKAYPLRINPKVLDAVQRWADDDLRSVNAQIEYLLRESLRKSGRLARAIVDVEIDNEEPPGMNADVYEVNELAPPMREDLRLAALLGLAGAIATALLFPYLQLLMPEALAKVPLPLPLVVLLQSGQAFLLLALMAFCGLRMGHATGLGVPWLRALMRKSPRKTQPWLLALACGAIAAVAVLALDPLFAAHMPAPLHPLPTNASGAHAFAGFLASFYGGIAEEIELRLFLVTLLAWGLSRFTQGRVAGWQLTLSVLLAAIVFGALHLPAAAQVWHLDAVVVARTLLLNGLAGVVFGWFYVRNGLESAMLSHFAADLVLHVFAPLAAG